MRSGPRNDPAWMEPRSAQDLSTLQDSDQDDDDREDQEEMDESAQGEGGYEPEQPEDEQDDRKGPQHDDLLGVWCTSVLTMCPTWTGTSG